MEHTMECLKLFVTQSLVSKKTLNQSFSHTRSCLVFGMIHSTCKALCFLLLCQIWSVSLLHHSYHGVVKCPERFRKYVLKQLGYKAHMMPPVSLASTGQQIKLGTPAVYWYMFFRSIRQCYVLAAAPTPCFSAQFNIN